MNTLHHTSRSVIEGLAAGSGLAWPLFLTGTLFRVMAFVVFAPLVSGLARLFLAGSGREIVANEEIAAFLIEPVGLLALAALAAVSLALLALEQACLMAVIHGVVWSSLSTLRYGFARSLRILGLAMRIVLRLLLVAAPFLAAAGLIYLGLLTEHDINYYLANRPPVFKLAVMCAVVLGIGIAVAVALVITRAFLALPILLFEAHAPHSALRLSAERSCCDRRAIALTILLWALASLAVASLTTTLFVWLGQMLLPLVLNRVVLLTLLAGTLVPAIGLAGLLVSIAANVCLSLLIMHWYRSTGPAEVTRRGWHAVESELASGPGLWRSGSVITAVSCVAIAAAGVTGWILIAGADVDDRTEIVAHRGASSVAPENTLAAVEQAIAAGADWIEVDVQRTADDQIVVVHDRDLKRIAGDAAVVTESSYADLARADVGRWFSAAFSGERIPLLEAVLERCRGRIKVNIELKYYGWDERLAQRVIGIVEHAGMERDIVIMSLQSRAVRQAKALRPNWQVGFLTAASLGDLTRSEADFLAVHSRRATPGFVRRAQRAGKAVQVWTVNDAIGMSRMFGQRVDALITDKPALAVRVLEERAEMDPAERLLITAGMLIMGETQHLDPATEITEVY